MALVSPPKMNVDRLQSFTMQHSTLIYTADDTQRVLSDGMSKLAFCQTESREANSQQRTRYRSSNRMDNLRRFPGITGPFA